MPHTLWIGLPALTLIIEKEREEWGERERGKRKGGRKGWGRDRRGDPRKSFAFC